MPIYAYWCQEDNCGYEVEEFHHRANDITEKPCPKCKGKMTRQIFSPNYKTSWKGNYIQDAEYSTDNPDYHYARKVKNKKKEKLLK